MAFNKTGFIASGYDAHREIKARDIYHDNKGRLVTVDKCESGRVHFVRVSFPFPVSLLERVFLDRLRLHRRKKAPVTRTGAAAIVQEFCRMINVGRDREMVK
ncbi:TPA: DUF4222 domain-containing protein [Salmonella enterica]|uniref:DUF4222 domain-containing protein n=1 Tax=Salmonella enterica TaxID=28901 RepID=A0A756IDZ2_SALER|nr:DUF4222 domain-containing protein [Salmonella enterica]